MPTTRPRHDHDTPTIGGVRSLFASSKRRSAVCGVAATPPDTFLRIFFAQEAQLARVAQMLHSLLACGGAPTAAQVAAELRGLRSED